MTEGEQVKYVVTRIAGAVVVIILLFGSFRVMGAGERGVRITLGQVSDQVLEEGIHLKVPLIQKIKQLDVKVQKEEVDATAASKDLQDVTTKVALNYHLEPDRVNKLWQSIGEDYKVRVIDPAIQEAVKAATARYTAEELITKRPLVKEDIKKLLFERLQKEFITVDDVSIVNFEFSKSFSQAIEAKVTAEQEALQAKNKLEQVKFEAEQRVTQARAEAEAIRIQAAALQVSSQLVELEAVKKWNGQLPQYMLGNTVPFLNLNK